MGLEKISAIVKQSTYILRIELEDWKDNMHYIEYSFHLGNHESNYTVHLAQISGNVPTALPEHKDLVFSTWDHKAKTHLNCPESYSGMLLLTVLYFHLFRISSYIISCYLQCQPLKIPISNKHFLYTQTSVNSSSTKHCILPLILFSFLAFIECMKLTHIFKIRIHGFTTL